MKEERDRERGREGICITVTILLYDIVFSQDAQKHCVEYLHACACFN